jgi:hypothetical protein
MNRRRRILLLGLALLLLLAAGVGKATLSPMPSQAERRASTLRLGMTLDQASSLCDKDNLVWSAITSLMSSRNSFHCRFADGSCLTVRGQRSWGDGPEFRISSLETTPPDHPLTRLRRSLARVLPFLGE